MAFIFIWFRDSKGCFKIYPLMFLVQDIHGMKKNHRDWYDKAQPVLEVGHVHQSI